MALLRGEVQGYDVDRMIVHFAMVNDGRAIQCAVSSGAVDTIEGESDVKSDHRVDQFMRLRSVIEERAARRFFENTPIQPPTDLAIERFLASQRISNV